MNPMMLFLSLIYPLAGYSQSFESFPISKAKAFIAKSEKCEVAVGMIISAIDGGKRENGEELVNARVLCITQATSKAGTIREKSGCALVTFDMATNVLNTPFMKNRYGQVWEDPSKTGGLELPMVVGKDCDAGGFEALLSKYPGAALGKTVEEALACGMDLGGRCNPTTLLLANKKSWEEAYLNAKKKIWRKAKSEKK